MHDTLPFPFEVAFLLLVLPIALVWLLSVASIAVLAARGTFTKVQARFRDSASGGNPIEAPGRAPQ